MSVAEYTMQWGSFTDRLGNPIEPTKYREDRYGSPEETLSQDGSGALRTLYTPWRSRVAAGNAFLGFTRLRSSGGYYYPSRVTPNYHPDYISIPFPNASGSASGIQTGILYADSLVHKGYMPDGVNPKGDIPDSKGGRVGAFLESQMTVKYTSYPYTILEDSQMSLLGAVAPGGDASAIDESTCLRYVWGILQPCPKYQTIPSADTVSWSFDNKPLTTTMAFMMAEGDLMLTWFGIPLALYDKKLVESLIGKTNSVAFGHDLAPNGSFDRGTLVFVMPTPKPYRRINGEIYLDITYRFKYFPFGANKFFRFEGPQGGTGTSVAGDTESGKGDGYYWATRRLNATRLGLFTTLDGKAIPENTYSAIPAVLGSPIVNVLLFPFGDYRNLFRARTSFASPIPGPTY